MSLRVFHREDSWIEKIVDGKTIEYARHGEGEFTFRALRLSRKIRQNLVDLGQRTAHAHDGVKIGKPLVMCRRANCVGFELHVK